ncbi:hypothetical protein [Hungatella sp.]|uniref:hypothetical protein n=1 Tax=Hungatella sp. TaxID=2613924 RepID=UPI003995CD5C
MPFLEKLKNQFLLLYGEEFPVALNFSGDDLTVSQEQATDVALVVNELVSNAYKHAFKGKGYGEIRVILKNGERLRFRDGSGQRKRNRRDLEHGKLRHDVGADDCEG